MTRTNVLPTEVNILIFLRTYSVKHGYSPTIREIAESQNLAYSGIKRYIDKNLAKNVLEAVLAPSGRIVSRTVKFTPQGLKVLRRLIKEKE